MNRQQRRMKKAGESPQYRTHMLKTICPTQIEASDFSKASLATICQALQLLINEISNRGYPIYDFDNKQKRVYRIKIIKKKVYFFAAEEADYEAKG